MKAKEVLSKQFIKEFNIDEDRELPIEYIRAQELLVSDRIDVLSKLIWLETFVGDHGSREYARRLYCNTLGALTNYSYIEAGAEKSKNSISSYEKVFHELCESLKGGFDINQSVIPIGENKGILDGAHRLAIALYYNLEIPITRIEGAWPDNGTGFLRGKSMDEDLIEQLVIEYCSRKSDVYVLCVWPKALSSNNYDQIEKIINKRSKVIYKKELQLDKKALFNFVHQLYRDMDWIGNPQDGFAGTMLKVDQVCGSDSGKLEVYFVENITHDAVLQLKEDIRVCLGMDKDSIHSTDTQQECKRVANILLNPNSLHLIRKGDPTRYESFQDLLSNFKKAVAEKNLDINDFVVDSSAVLAVYGLREANDFDYISACNIELCGDKIENHNNSLTYHRKSIEELLYNPKYYFYYDGIKFVCLDLVREFKERRKYESDVNDLGLICEFDSDTQNIREFISAIKIDSRRKIILLNSKFHSFVDKHPYLHSILRRIKRMIFGFDDSRG